GAAPAVDLGDLPLGPHLAEARDPVPDLLGDHPQRPGVLRAHGRVRSGAGAFGGPVRCVGHAASLTLAWDRTGSPVTIEAWQTPRECCWRSPAVTARVWTGPWRPSRRRWSSTVL